MSEPIIAPREEAERIMLTPESLVWRRFGDVRLFFGAGTALLLQVAHPTVGAGVRDHSNFEAEPYDRLLRTVDYLSLLTWGGEGAIEMGPRLRELHKSIKGVNPDGTHYHALEPEAYAWVHATLIDAALAAHRRFIGPLRPDEYERFYDEYRPLGRLVGVRTRDLPESWPEFRDYVATMIDERLERTESVETVLRAMGSPSSPPQMPAAVERFWGVLRVPPAHTLSIATRGLLAPRARERLAISLSAREKAELRLLGAAARAAGPLMPARLRNYGPSYLRWRRREIAVGPLGAESPGRSDRELGHAA